jgi:hypothetical protein
MSYLIDIINTDNEPNLINDILLHNSNKIIFKPMTRQEILALNEEATKSILFELVHPYLKTLYIYYKDLFGCEPILMVTSVSNACQYVKIVPLNEFLETLCEYLEDYNCIDEDSENFAAFETINFNSRLLKDCLPC